MGSPGKWPLVFRAVRAKGGEVLKARYDTLKPGFDIVEPLDWTGLRPY